VIVITFDVQVDLGEQLTNSCVGWSWTRLTMLNEEGVLIWRDALIITKLQLHPLKVTLTFRRLHMGQGTIKLVKSGLNHILVTHTARTWVF